RLTVVEDRRVTVEDAIRLALDQLQLGREDVDIEILSDAGTEEDEEALVRVTARARAPRRVSASSGGRSAPSGPRPEYRDRGGQRRSPGPRRVPGDRPSSRGAPPARIEREIDPNRVSDADVAPAQ